MTDRFVELRPRVRLSIESEDGLVVVDEAVAEMLQAVGESGSLVSVARSLV